MNDRIVGRIELTEIDTPERRAQLAAWMRKQANALEERGADYDGTYIARFRRIDSRGPLQ